MVRYRYGTRGLALCAAAATLVSLRSLRSAADDARDTGTKETRAGVSEPRSAAAPHMPKVKIDVRAALAKAHRVGSTWAATDGADRRIELTLCDPLQERARHLLREYRVPHAAVAAIEPATGRLLAYVSHSSEAAGAGDLVRDASAPAASVFKLVTASALIEAGVDPRQRTCYSGGSSRLERVHLEDHPRRDSACASLDEALGKSINAIFAKLADRHLNAGQLLRYARAYGFGRVLPFEFAPSPSSVEVPGDRLEFARTAAGFWHTRLSPLHAALIAATIANDGAMPQPYAVDRVLTSSGQVAARHLGQGGARRVIRAATARALGRMMQRTVKDGTARAAFLDERGRPVLPGISVAGKTGSLSANNPYRAYSWWVGFAPADKPRIALAVLVVNGPLWRIKSSYVARELLRKYLSAHEQQAAVARSETARSQR